MSCIKHHSKTLIWFVALLLSVMVAGCGSGGGGGDSGAGAGAGAGSGTGTSAGAGIQITGQELVPGAPNAIPPGTAAPGATGGTGAGSSGPTVISSNPTNGATNVAVSTAGPGNVVIPRTVSATFSEAMNPATIASPASSFTVKETISGNSVTGTVSMNAANTVATFQPNAVLASNRQFTAIVSTAATSTVGTALASIYGWSFTTGSQTGQAPIDLGSAANFLVLAGTSIDNVSSAFNPTRVNGQLGIAPGGPANTTGFTDSTPAGTGIIATGGIQFGPVVRQAKNDLLAALGEANARSSHQVPVDNSDLATFVVNGGSPGIYPPGLYTSLSTLNLSSGNMTLDAQGDPDAVWVFKAASDLVVADTRRVLLRNGARASHVFWSLGSSAILGDQVSFKGNIMAGTSNTLGAATAVGTTLEGRVLSVSGLQMFSSTLNAPAP